MVKRLLLVFIGTLISASIFAQAVELCNDGKDNNGDGKIDCADGTCSFGASIEKGCNCFDSKDNDNDNKIDAEDTDCAAQFANVVETCNDGKDNNADGKVDCLDATCIFSATVEKGCNCYDSKDNDGDGKIDQADNECASYYGLTFVGSGSTCSIQPPPGSAFSTIAAPQSSSQNTADTPAKVVVGDVNFDGKPDVVVTSKWNSTLQVVATSTYGGFAVGDIMGDFRTPGSKIFPLSGSNYVFEHEVMIADIDRDKVSEIYAIASERGGSPNNKPVRYFLTGFKYAKKDLIPLWNAVDLGTDRPGAPGIADFDGDGKAEVYLKNRIYAAETGFLLADGGGNWDTFVNSGPVAVNILGDSKLELVCGPIIYSVPSLATRNALATMTVLKDMNSLGFTPYYPKGFNDLNEFGIDQASFSSTADFDGDGFVDVLITGSVNCSGNEASPCGTNISTIFYWNVHNNTVKTFTPTDPLYANGWIWGAGRINLGDPDGDGKLEAIFAAGSQIFCLELDAGGNLVLKWKRTINDSLSGILSVSVYDFNNDGKPEVIYRDSQELVVIDGLTGATKLWSASCQSHTFTEGPVIADVNGDGNTDICVTCYTNTGSFDYTKATPQEQSLAQTRLYFSSTNAWLPTRKVWNEHPYFVTNINDDLSLPKTQMDQTTIFSAGACPNGMPGPQKPYNVFMNQLPNISQNGCPEFPAPDLTYYGDDPATPGVDSNGDGSYSPAVVITPPICGNLVTTVYFNIVNNGDLPITDTVPVSFFNGDPTVSPVTATKLVASANTITISNLGVGQKMVSPTISITTPGSAFKLYIVMYNDGTSLPIVLTGQSTKECTISNNIYSVDMTPTPFTVTVEKISDNFKCLNSAPDTGQLKAHVFVGASEVVDLSPYSFQWYTGTTTASPIAAPNGTKYNPGSLAEGTYTVVVTNIAKGCKSSLVQGTLVRTGNDPPVAITIVSHQTKCSPANGELNAVVTDGTTGYTFDWFDVALSPQGITGAVAKNLTANNYLVRVTKGGCSKLSTPVTVNGPQVPDAQTTVLQNVVDCVNPNAGSVSADALFNGVIQPAANYTFDWYFYNNVTGVRGSILPPANGTGQTRTALPVGYYQVTVKDNTTLCSAGTSPLAQVQSQTVIPVAQITQVAPQTSCDAANPNGILNGEAVIGATVQNPSGFTFEWFKGDNTLLPTVATVSGTNGKQVNKVAGGGIYYTLRVTSALHCSSTSKFIIAENLQYPVATLTPTSNSICNSALATGGLYNGAVTAAVTFGGVAVAAGDPLYSYAWHKGSLATDPVPSPNSTTNVLSQQNGGNYTLVVTKTDVACPSTAKTATVTNVQALPVLTTATVASTNCTAPNANGTASIVTVDATAVASAVGYTYAWVGPVAPSFPVTAGTNNSNTAQLIKLQGGAGYTYTATVTNTATGCQNTAALIVADAKALPVITLATVANGVCNPGLTSPAATYSGKITATVTNQVGALTDYTFAFGAGMGAGTQLTSPNHNQYTALNGGATAYSAVATHTVTGCVSAAVTTPVTNTLVLPALTTSTTPSTNCAVGKEDGKANILTVDGTAVASATGYTYAWTGPVGAPAFPVTAGTNTSNTAQLIKVQGGAGYNYSGLVTKQATGCQTTVVLNVTDGKVLPIITLATVDNGVCNPGLTSPSVNYSGKITATVTNQVGALTDYTFAFGAGMGAGTIPASPNHNQYTALNGGATAYTAAATHTLTGCVSSVVTTPITNTLALPVLTTSITPSTNCVVGKEDGKANVLTVDGTAVATATGYTYAWTGPGAPAFPVNIATNTSNTAQLIKVQGGAGYNYSGLVTKQLTGCQTTVVLNVTDGKVLPIITLATVDNGVCNPGLTSPSVTYSGKITATVTNLVGALTDYTFAFGAGMGAGTALASPNHNQYTGLNGGATAYTAAATHTLTGCVSSVVTTPITNTLALPVLTTSITPSTNCVVGKEDGKANVLTVDGTAVGVATGYTYAWTGPVGAPAFPVTVPLNTSNTAQLIKVQGGAGYNYSGLVTKQLTGCQTTVVLNVTDGKVLPIITLATVDNGVCNPGLTSPSVTYSGKITATVTNLVGALTDYTFAFGAGMGAGTALASPNHNQYTGLNGGATAYTAAATHTLTGCVSSVVTTPITNTLALPVLTTSITPSTNCVVGKEDGKANVLTVDGTAVGVATGYTYAWTGPVGAPAFPVTVPLNTSNTAQLIKVQGGAGYNYSGLVTKQLTGCQTTVVLNVTDGKVLPIITLATVDNGVCNPGLTSPSVTYSGKITATVTNLVGALTDYTFAFGAGMGAGTALASPNHNQYTGLNGGATAYTAAATHTLTGCVSSVVTTPITNTLALPVLTTSITPSTNCVVGKEDGKANVLTVDGTAVGVATGYTYAWTGPVGAPAFPVTVPVNTSNTAQLIKVQGGAGYNYSGLVTKQLTGCQTTVVLNVTDGKVLPIITLATVDNGVCNPGLTLPVVTYDGKITATVTNQVGALTDYTFAFGAGMNAGTSPASPNHNQYTGLNGGATAYTAAATHTLTGCVSSVVTTPITNTLVLPLLTTSITPSTNCVVGKEDGKANVLTVDGTAVATATGYTYAWTGPAAFPVTIPTNTSNTAQLIKVQGGAGYNYSGLVTKQLTGCQTTVVLNVTDGKVLPIITLATVDNGVCNPGLTLPVVTYDGKITATVTNQVGALTDYTFAFGAGMNAGASPASPNHNQYTGLNGGATAYTAAATHTLTGCVSSVVTTPITNTFVLPLLTTSITPSTNCVVGKEDGKANVLTVDGTAVATATGYTYAWTGPAAFPVTIPTNTSNTAQLIKVQGGAGYNYSGLVTKQLTGCQTTVVLNVTDGKVLPIITLAPVDNGVCNPGLTLPVVTYDGKITATVTNQVGALTDYTFAFGAGMNAGTSPASPNHNQYTGLNGGATAYTAAATHTLTGCVSSVVTTPITNTFVLPLLTTSITPSTNCVVGKEDGKANVLTVDGTAVATATGYTYAWTGPTAPAFPVNAGTNTSNTAQLIQAQGGAGYDYTGLVTKQLTGCQTTVVLNITDGKSLPTFTLTPTPNTICDPVKATASATPGIFDGKVTAAVNAAGNYAASVAGDFNFTWSSGLAGVGQNVLTNRDVGTYTMTATHTATGCVSNSFNAMVTDGKVLPAITTDQTPSENCPGGLPHGIAKVLNVVPNGMNYTYKWFDGNTTGGAVGPVTTNTTSTTNNYTDVQGGATLIEYTTEVTILQTGCVNTATVGVADDSKLPQLGPLTGTDNTFCVDGDGTATISTLTYRGAPVAGPGYLGFSFAWSGGTQGPQETITALTAGTYTLQVTHDNDNCTSNPVPVTIADDLTTPLINITETPQTSCDVALPNGTLTATVDVAGTPTTAGYSFVWRDNGNPLVSPGTLVPVGQQVAPSGINKLPGNIFYTVLVTNSTTKCFDSKSFELSESITLPTLTLAAGLPQTKCSAPSAPDGSATATVTTPALTSTFTYYWYRESSGVTTNDPAVVKANVNGPPLPGVGNFNKKAAAVASSTNTQSSLVSGRFTVVVDDDFKHCTSQPVSVDILDNTVGTITMTIGSLPTACNAFGSLTMKAVRVSAPASANFTFDVFRGGLTNAIVPVDYYSAPPNPPQFAAPKIESLTVANNTTVTTVTPATYNSDIYTVVVTDDFGCKNVQSFFLPFKDAHTIDALTTNVTNCTVDNGKLAMRTIFPTTGGAGLDDNNQSGYQFTFYTGGVAAAGAYLQVGVPAVTFTNPYGAADTNPSTVWPVSIEKCNTPAIDEDGDGQFDATDLDCIGRVTTNAVLPPGFYLLESMDKATLCKAFKSVEIKQDARPAIIDVVGAIKPNTSCDLTVANGAATVSLTKDPFDLVPAAGITYSLGVVPAPLITAVPIAVGTLPTANKTVSGLKPEPGVPSYTFTLTSTNGCVSTQTIVVPDQPIVSQLVAGSVLITDAEFCTAAKEESAQVVLSNIKLPTGANELLSDYQIDWFTDAALTTNVYSALGDPAAIAGGDEFINDVPGGTGTVPAGTVWKGDYYVRAQKITDVSNTGGVGCFTSPFTVNIQDNSVKPAIVLTPAANTSCDPLFFEGSIKVDVTTATGPGSIAPAYTYAWTPTGAGGQPVNSAGNSGGGNMQLNIDDGTFNLFATDEKTGCTNTLDVTIDRDTPPVISMTATSANLLNCAVFDGRADAASVSLNPGGATAITDFDFVWYKTSPATAPVLDGTGAAPLDTELTLATYPAITIGSYFVKAVRKTGTGAGAGCASAAVKADILDERVYPTVSMATISNTACDGVNYDGKITVTAGMPPPTAATTYNFVWTSDPDGAGAAFTASNSPDDHTASPFSTLNTNKVGPGNYAIRVTAFSNQCFTDGTVDILTKTVPMSITSVTTVDATLCSAPSDGSGTVATLTDNAVPSTPPVGFKYTWANNPAMTAPLVSNTAALTLGSLNFGTYYVQAKKDAVPSPATAGVSGSGCQTPPIPFIVLDKRVTPTIAFTTVSSTACDANMDGQITVTASTSGPAPASTANYNFVWTNDPDGAGVAYSAANSPTNNTASPFSTVNTDKIGAISTTVPGTYSIRVTNFASGCFVDGSIDVLTKTLPLNVSSVTSTDVTLCSSNNGTGTVVSILDNVTTVTGAAPLAAGYNFNWDASPTMAGPSLGAGVTVGPPLAVGTFYVQAQKKPVVAPATPGVSGSGCFTPPASIIVLDKRVTPTIAFATVSSTACDANMDGQITVTATTSGPAPASTANYNFVWTNDPDGAGVAYSAANSPTNNTASPFSTVNTDKIGAISTTVPGTYSIRVTNFASGCFVDGSIDVLTKTLPLDVSSVTSTDVTLCSSNNGTGTVVSILDNVTTVTGAAPLAAGYNFNWDASPTMAGPSLGAGVTVGPPLAVGTFYVQAQKKPVVAPATPGVSGSGCFTPPAQIIVLDKRVTPTIAFATVSSTACDANMDGQITVTASTSGPAPASTANYNFVWTNDPDGAGVAYSAANSPTNNTASPFSTVNTDKIGAISTTVPGTYSIRVTNFASGCFVDGSIDVLTKTLPLNVSSVTSTDVTLCSSNNGTGTVVSILDNVTTVTGAAPLAAGYNFNWDASPTMAGPSLGAGVTVGPPLAVGTFYVQAQKKPVVAPATPGVSGSGCFTPPASIIVLDKRVTPTIAFATVSSTACDANMDGQITVTATTSGPAPASTANYNFVWTNDPDGAGVAYSAANSPTNNTASPFSTVNTDKIGAISTTVPGTYSIRVTNFASGCFVDGSIDVLTKTLPLDVSSVTSTDVTLCSSNNGTGTVVSILDNVTTVTGAAPLAAGYNFNWDASPTMAGPSLGAGVTVGPPLAVGTFYVQAQKKPVVAPATPGVSGSGCFTPPAQIIVLDKRVTPTIAFATVSSTACDANLDGQITVTASTSGPAPASTANYNFVWTNDPDGAGVAYSAANSPTNNTASPFSTVNTDKIGAISTTVPGTYSIRVTNFASGCFVDGSIDVLTKTLPLDVSSVTSTDVTLCSSNNGTGTVVSILDNVTTVTGAAPLAAGYNFNWDASPTMAGPSLGAGVTVGPPLAVGTFYVQAQKKPVVAPATPGVSGSGCFTPPASIIVLDKRVTPTIAFATVSSTACDANMDGQITVTASTSGPAPASTANYNFVWTNDPDGAGAAYSAANSPTNNTASPFITASTDKIGAISTTVPGTYSIRVTNFVSGCFVDGSIDILTKTLPLNVSSVTSTDVTLCSSNNGTGTVVSILDNVTPVTGAGLAANFTFNWDASPTMAGPSLGTGVTVGPPLAVGTFYVQAKKNAVVAPGIPGVSGSGCFTPPASIIVLDKRVTPTIAFATVSSTACDGNMDGQITVTASTSGPAPASTANYNFVWTNDPDGAGVAYSASNSPTNNTASPWATLSTDKIGAISTTVPGTYSIRVTNFVSGCFVDGSIDILTKTLPLNVSSATSTDVTLCSSNNGTGTVVSILDNVTPVTGAGLAANFTFNWDASPTMAGPSLGTGVTVGPPLAVGTFYVQAKKNAVVAPGIPGVSGSGCFTPPASIIVLDKRITPTIAITTVASTSCDNNFDGKITINATTSGPPGAGANYDFLWQTDPDGIGTGPVTVADALNKVSPHITGVPDLVGPGDYTIRVRNVTTQCFTDGVTSLLKNPQPVSIVTVNKVDQKICNPDGQITVASLTVNATADYSYEWFRQTPTSTPLQDAASAVITATSLSALNYPTMGADTYFVVASKLPANTPGSGCVTPPFRVDIVDLSVNPKMAFTFTPNSSCDPTLPNGTVLANASEQDGTNTATYSFVWLLNSAALPGVTVPTNTSNSSQLAKAGEGQYTLTIKNTSVTGCSASANLDVNLNQDISKPNIIDTDTIDPLDCLASGTADVVSISVGGGPAVTGPALAAGFGFEWYKGDFLAANLIKDGAGVPITAPTITTLLPDEYYVLVKDLTTQCKSLPTEVDILDDLIVYPVVAIAKTAPQISCLSSAGTAVLASTADGKTDTDPNYTFNWFNSLDLTGPSIGIKSTISNLKAGNYSVEAKSLVSGCAASALYIVPDESPQYIPIISSVPEALTFCVGKDGNVQARVLPNDDYPFTYNFTADLYFSATPNLASPPDVAGVPKIPGTQLSFLQPFLSNGFYTFKITDNNTGCFQSSTVEVLDKRTNPVVVIVEENPLTNCDPAIANGQLAATADKNKIAGYTFDWYAGTSVPAGGIPLQSSDKLIGLGKGSYTVHVINVVTGCAADQTGVITDGTLLPPVPTGLVVFDRKNCVKLDGWVTANVGGAVVGYIFNWYDGQSVKASADFTAPDYTDRDIGPYTVTATDAVTGCISLPTTVTVKDIRVTPKFRIDTTPSYCSDTGKPKGAGSLLLTLTNSDSVSLDVVDWVDANTNTPVGTGTGVYEMFPGVYNVTATSTEGCVSTGSAEVGTEISPYNGISLNGDNQNDFFIIDCITNFPNNNVKIFNRVGIKVFDIDYYNNVDRIFKGIGELGVYVQGNELPDGTYFYIIDKRDGQKPKTGYLEIIR